jgi:serine/threonine protein kinase
MELLPGRELTELIRADPPLSLLQKLEILRQVARALNAAHRNGIVHRDIKPGNIMVQPDGPVVKVMDFGIARLARSSTQLTQSGFIVGTIAYIAPEQLQASEADARSDIFAFGVVGYELLSGVHPFAAADSASLMYRIVHVEPAPLREVLPGCTPALHDIVHRALAKDPNQRYQTIEDLLLDLEPVLIELRRKHADTLLSTASELARAQRLDEALGVARQILELDPSSSVARDLRERILRERNQAARKSSPPPRDVVDSSAEAPIHAPVPPSGGVALPPTSHKLEGFDAWPRRWILFVFAALLVLTVLVLWRAGSEAGVPIAVIVALAAGGIWVQNRWRRSTRQAPEPVIPAVVTATPVEANATVIQPRPSTELLANLKGAPGSAMAPQPVPSGAEITRMFTLGVGQTPFPEVYLAFQESPERMLTGKPVRVRTMPFHVGRAGPELAIHADPGLSRQHAVIDWTDGRFTIADLGSANGTYVDGRRLKARVPEPLIFGNIIRLSASTTLTFTPGDLAELPDLTGCVIAERYELTSPVRVGLKSVYEAKDLRTGKPVAIKLLSPSLAGYPGYLEQFRHEAETAARLTHPHICPILDYGDAVIHLPGSGSATAAYISSVLLNGGSLERRLNAGNSLSHEETLDCIQKIADALDYAHSGGVLHGNIKPASIMFDAGGRAYLIDFAIGSTVAGKTRRSFLGTPEYMAPEVWQGEEPGSAADRFALGLLAYLLLTGSRPFDTRLDPDAALRSFSQGPPAAHELAARNGRPGVPPPVSAVLRKALSLSVPERYSSAGEFLQALREGMANPESKAGTKPSVFISYRRDESAMAARVLATALESKYGLYVFLDTERVDSAAPFPEELERAVRKADVFICMLAKKTLSSAWVNDEIRIACDLQKPMIPVFQESFPEVKSSQNFPPHVTELLRRQAVHLLDRRGIYIDPAVEKLARMILDTSPASRRSAM